MWQVWATMEAGNADNWRCMVVWYPAEGNDVLFGLERSDAPKLVVALRANREAVRIQDNHSHPC